MPTLPGQEKKLDIEAERKARKQAKAAEEEDETKLKKSSRATQSKVMLTEDEDYDDDEEDDDDEDSVIQESLRSKKNDNNKTIKFALLGVGLVFIVVIAFLIFGKSKPEEPSVEGPNAIVDSNGDIVSNEVPEDIPPEVPEDDNFGTQDFREDTNMTSDSSFTDPEDFTKDIYGLTLRVDYEVAKIQNASDFVSYTKKRGTWGGGLELYYLDAEYKGSRYVIQVPFQYYKELDDEGIIPVKMEVLRVKSETDDTYLSVVSYMCLDEKTLESVLKTQKR